MVALLAKRCSCRPAWEPPAWLRPGPAARRVVALVGLLGAGACSNDVPPTGDLGDAAELGAGVEDFASMNDAVGAGDLPVGRDSGPRDASSGEGGVVDIGPKPPADMAALCGNGRREPGETDVDCGGPCAPCGEMRGCVWSWDCAGRVCATGRCDKAALVSSPHVVEGFLSAAVADVTGDGLRDIVLGQAGGQYQILERVRGGGFVVRPAAKYNQGMGSSTALGLGDWNRDGRVDLIAGSGIDRSVEVVPNQGGGVFSGGKAYQVTAVQVLGEGRSFATGDADGDGDIDIAVSGPEEGLTLLRNRGDGSFGVEIFSRHWSPFLAGGDFDRDGIMDVAVPFGAYVKRLSKLLPCVVASGLVVVVGDFNGDGWPDLQGESDGCLGDGKGALLPPRPVGQPAYGFAPFTGWLLGGDLNGDGRTDLVHLIRDPIGRESLEVAFGTANGNMRYSLSMGFQAQIFVPRIGRVLSDTRDDLILGVWTPPQPFELRIVSLR